jgi:RNA polymerase sigma factor (sigma-70 family)
MAMAAFSGVMWHLRQAAFAVDGVQHTDGELLDLFRTDRDEAAFAALVRRHGPMVFGVCRRTLRNDADAEDAFQATFLVLARKAHDVRPAGQVGHWLYGVAYNTARKARVMNRRRLARERRAGEERLPDDRRDSRSEVHEALDIELSRLPDKFRAPVVLCDLEGEPLKEAARRLDCPAGTVASRLARARAILRRNLARRGVGLAALIAPGAAAASVPSKLAMQTTRAAIGAAPISTSVLKLTEGVIQAMFLSKVKTILAVIVAAGVLVAGIGNGSFSVLADQDKPAKPGAAKTDKPVKPEKPAPGDAKKLPMFSGTVKNVQADKSSITITATKGDQSIDRTFDVAKEVKVVLDGKEAKLADVKAGVKVTVKLAEDKSTVVAIANDKPADGDVKKPAGFTGNVKSVDAAKGTITVTATKGDTSIDRTFPVAENVKVSIDGREAKLGDLKAGTRVSIKFGDDRTTAAAIASEGTTLIGELKEVAASHVKVAVKVLADRTDKASAKVEEKTLKVAEDIKVAVEGQKKATLSDLKTGSSVAVRMSADGEKAIAITSPAKRADGDVKKPMKPDGDPAKPVKPGADPVKPVKPAADPVKPVKPDPAKPGADPVKPIKPVKPNADKPVKPEKPAK